MSLGAPLDRARVKHWGGHIGLDLVLMAGAVLAVTAPLWFTNSGFAIDFTNHLWLTWVAGKTLLQTGHPSYFLSVPGYFGVFYPFYAFYGGTLYMITGGFSDLLGGQPLFAFAAVTTLAVAGSYGGMLWLGREFGLRRLAAHAPALTVVTSAYYITDLYGRGAWSEFMATAVIAPVLAGGVHLARAPRWRPLPVLAFVVSMVFFTGSHNITLVWGTLVIAVTLVIMWIALGVPRALPYRRLAKLAGLAITCALVNAWFLLPNLTYAKNTEIATQPIESPAGGTGFFDTPAVVLNPLRHVPIESSTPALFVQVPDWFLGWALIAGALLLWRLPRTGPLARIWIGSAAVVALLLGMFMFDPFWKIVPFPLNEIQFAYRIGSYIFYAIAGLVLVSALLLQRAAARERTRTLARGLGVGLLAVSAVSLGLCLWQQWVPTTLFPETSYLNRADALASVNEAPHTWYDKSYYRDAHAPVVQVPHERVLYIEPTQIHGDRFSGLLNVPPGREPIETNITGGSYIAHISGLERLGRTSDGYTVVRRPDDGSGPVHVTIETTHSLIIESGWALSILAILAIFTILTYTSVRSVRARRRAPADLGRTTTGRVSSAPLG